MGLDFVQSSAHWSYGGFMSFRCRLAEAAGLPPLHKMDGYTDNGISWDGYTDAIVPLLHHSDCDGELSPEVCATVAPRLREIVMDWTDDSFFDYDKRHALMLADGMDYCAAKGEALEFC